MESVSGKKRTAPGCPGPRAAPPKIRNAATLNPGMALGVAATLRIRIGIRHAECYAQIGFRGKVALLRQICSPSTPGKCQSTARRISRDSSCPNIKSLSQ